MKLSDMSNDDQGSGDFLMVRFCDERGQKLTEIMIRPGSGHKIAIPLDAEHMHVETAYDRRMVRQAEVRTA